MSKGTSEICQWNKYGGETKKPDYSGFLVLISKQKLRYSIAKFDFF